ncbi:MAG TPA: SUMF1/EgtB/PvdO family nonheme iron enzyme, partial [Nitrospira sp.]|nr:SUMF1/EgtB/PvdO family nonheme iron enzyme [Nitrospira sp.]
KLDAKKANYGQNVGRTMPVDSYPEGVSGFGVYNMAGNVFEWVSDWYDPKYYKESVALNPQGPDKGYNFANQGPVRVLRGGSWLAPETSLHTSHRFWNQPENNSYGVGLGFRCAKSAPAATDEAIQAGRDAFIQALIAMGAEKHADAMASIEKALAADPGNKEYLATRDLIRKSMKSKK